jgi:hypothetical protein
MELRPQVRAEKPLDRPQDVKKSDAVYAEGVILGTSNRRTFNDSAITLAVRETVWNVERYFSYRTRRA